MSVDRRPHFPVVVTTCPTCGHTPAWHDAAGCTARFTTLNDTGREITLTCPCARTLGTLAQT